ncbi:MAG: sensor domain-containing protein [Candidatus Aminicenantes bacterium]|nr:MAG: sensor domain-containing protein [Candidatus Aminicenantes bacterium]
MFKDVYEYLEELKKELKGCDPALIQDALSDAEGHLRMALEEALLSKSSPSEVEAIEAVTGKYGDPKEIASAYRTIESRTSPSLIVSRRKEMRSSWARFFGVLSEPKAWGAFFYMLLSFVTGVVFGGWALFAGFISFSSLVFVIGIPIVGLFLLSIRGIALLEGRIVEALLGIRMPRRPVFFDKNLGWKDKFMGLLKDSYTWKALLYAALHFPLGFIYSLGISCLFVFSLSFIVSPVLELIFHLPLELFGLDTFTPVWFLPIICIAGFFLLPLTFHLAKLVGKVHGRYAKSMLVRA